MPFRVRVPAPTLLKPLRHLASCRAANCQNGDVIGLRMFSGVPSNGCKRTRYCFSGALVGQFRKVLQEAALAELIALSIEGLANPIRIEDESVPGLKFKRLTLDFVARHDARHHSRTWQRDAGRDTMSDQNWTG